MKRLAGSTLLAVGLLSAPLHAQTKLTFTAYVPATYSVTACDAVFMDEVAKRTNGAVVFETFYASTLLNAPDTYPGIGRGAADLGNGAPAGYNRADYPLTNLLPFTTDDPVAATYAFHDMIKESEALNKEYERQNLKLLYGVVTSEYAVWTMAPVRTTADLKGKRVRALLATGDALAKMGATVVAMTFPDAVDAMTRGGLDGFGNLPFDLAVSSGMNKVGKYAVDMGFGIFSAQTTAMNLDKWNSLTPEVRAVMQEVADSIPETCWKPLVNKDIEMSVDTILAQGDAVEMIVFSDEEKQRLAGTVGAELRAEWTATAKAAGHADADAFYDRYIELVRKYEADSDYKTGFERVIERKK